MNKKPLLLLILRFIGVVALSALVGVLMPTSWMVATHRWVRLGAMPPSSRRVPRPFAFSIPRFSNRCLSNAGVKRGTLFNSDWFTRRRFCFPWGNLYGRLPLNRNAMVVDGPRGTTRIFGGYRNFFLVHSIKQEKNRP
ncbi:hypothetical protein N8550_03095 [Pirellulaceae bacterium]|nr:hypothetical protein [Pirellulaceae bacterium]